MKKEPLVKDLYLGRPCYIIGNKFLGIDMGLNNSKRIPCVEKVFIHHIYYSDDMKVVINVGSDTIYLSSPSSIESFFLDQKEAEEYCLVKMKETLKEAVKEARKYAMVVENIEKLIRNKEFGEF